MPYPPTGKIYIGTSGWQYGPWKGPFYPENIKPADLLPFYAKRFNTVEINTSFYGTPDIETIKRWRRATAADFIFSVKAHRYLTHRKRLIGDVKTFAFFFEILPGFGRKLGPILYQLPPRWQINLDRLEHFLQILPKCYRATFEFRDASWFSDETYDLLRYYNAAFCIYDLNRRRSPTPVTADFIYLRLHGPARPYRGSYSSATLRRWSHQCLDWQRQGLDIFCYFDNDEKGYAIKDAAKLIAILQRLHDKHPAQAEA